MFPVVVSRIFIPSQFIYLEEKNVINGHSSLTKWKEKDFEKFDNYRANKVNLVVFVGGFFFFFFFFFLEQRLSYMDVPGLGVELELQLPAYTTAIATPDSSHIDDLHHSSLAMLDP